MKRPFHCVGIVLLLALAGRGEVVVQDKVVAGGPDDFMEVRHLILKGTNAEIGQALASIGKQRFGLKPTESGDALRTRVQRLYFEKNYPALFERMRGVAAAFDKRLDEDAWDCSGLFYLLGLPHGCSVVHYPPGVTADGNSVVSRNYDFGTGTLLDMKPKPGELPVNARPYLIEMHPDNGYPSMALCAFDLLSGVIDGINSEGLTVTILADDEVDPKYPLDPAPDGGVGLDECQMLRMLLDTCANVEQAKQALLMTKQYYTFIPNHFLIADRHGHAFVWEYSHAHNREYIVENSGKPLVSTNFRLHQHLEGDTPPSAAKAKSVCQRFCALSEGIAAEKGKLTIDFMKKNHKQADATMPVRMMGLRAPIRTIWHALYVPEKRTLQVSFYLRDEADPQQPGKIKIVRSDYLEFTLGK